MDLMARVFVVQQMTWRDKKTGKVEDKYDYSPAEMFGDLQFLVGPGAKPFDPEPIIVELRDKLFDFSDDDFLLLVGNPTIIGWATAIAADLNEGRLKTLQWHGKEQRYIMIKSQLWNDGLQDQNDIV